MKDRRCLMRSTKSITDMEKSPNKGSFLFGKKSREVKS